MTPLSRLKPLKGNISLFTRDQNVDVQVLVCYMNGFLDQCFFFFFFFFFFFQFNQTCQFEISDLATGKVGIR